MGNISDNGSSSTRESSKTIQISNTPSSTGRRLRSSTRLRTINDNRKDNSLSSSFMKSARLNDSSIMDFATNDTTLTTTTNIQDKVAMFMDTIRIAMETLMQDHGYSRERAKISLLDQLVSFTYTSTRQPETKRMDTILRSPRNAVDVSTTSVPLSHAPTLAISDEKLFDCMRKKNIGMEHATIALTIEQAISSTLNDPNSSYSSISEILDTWIQCLQHVQPKPLTHLTLKSSSAFGSPFFHIPTMTPITAQQQPEPTLSIKASTIQQSKNPPSTPVSTMDPTGNGKPISSHTRSRAGGKKSNKISMATPPLSTITIATTSSTSSSTQQRSRSDSVTQAVSAKLTSSTSVIDGESNQHIVPASRGKPPLAPNTNTTSAASGAGIVTTTSLNSSSSSSSSNKRTNMDSAARLEHQQESSSGGRPASPSSLTLPSSNKRQRRSTSMSSDN